MSEVSKLKKELDKLLRQVLLKVSKKNSKGYYQCPLNNTWHLPHNMDVCHYIDRQWLGTRWDLENCILCSRYSNQIESQEVKEGHKSLHHKKFEQLLGKEKIEELEKRKQKKFYSYELKELYNCLIEKIK
jgi:hypothetical protein